MSTWMRKGLVFLGPLALLLPLPAAAQTVAVLGVGGSANPEVHSHIGSMLIDAIAYDPSLEGVDRRDVNLDEAVMLLGCAQLDTSCLGELAATLEVDRVLYAALDGDPATLQVVYFDSVESMNLLDTSFPAGTDAEMEELELHLVAGVAQKAVLQVTSQHAGSTIYIDGAASGSPPVVALDLAPGSHTVEARCDGCQAAPHTVDLVRGRFTMVDATPEEAAVAVTEPVEPGEGEDEGGGGGSQLLPVLTIAVGGALVITGVAFAFMTQSTQDDFDATDSLSEAQDLADTGETQALLTNVLLASGAAITATGVILLFTMGGDDDEADAPPTAHVRATPWLAPSAGGLVVDWTF